MADDSTKIVSWTLAGPGTAAIIGDALRSVAPIVSDSFVIWTGEEWGSEERAVHDSFIAAQRGPVIEDVIFHWNSWAWRNDFGAARSAALDVVEGWADWSLMVDTDERVVCPDPAALRAYLSSLPDSVQVVLVHHNDGSHTRERFFRMPARHKFAGRTHEMLPCPENEQAIAPPELIQWNELPKTREQLRAKFERDVVILRGDIAANPDNGAAYYYLGISLQSLALYAREDVCECHATAGCPAMARALFNDAIDAYREHRRIDTAGASAWHEATAFSCYRAAECYLALEQPDRAIDCAAAGLVLDAGIAELYWIAAVASLQMGRLEQARSWAESAKAHAKGSESERRRKGFRIPRGLTTGPDEVLEFVRERMAEK